MERSFDEQCYDLAELFLVDSGWPFTVERCEQLAAKIQDTIETFLEGLDNG